MDIYQYTDLLNSVITNLLEIEGHDNTTLPDMNAYTDILDLSIFKEND